MRAADALDSRATAAFALDNLAGAVCEAKAFADVIVA
jgi:hypothetical protein